MKTIKQLADETGSYKQKIFRIIKKHNIVTVKCDGFVTVDVTAENLIKSILLNESRNSCTDTVSTQSVTDVTVLEQLKIKDKQIEEKDNQIKKLQQLLDQQQQLQLNTQKQLEQLQIEYKGGSQTMSFFNKLFKKNKE